MTASERIRQARESAVDVWLAAKDDLIECSECGHVHFDTKRREYVPCPLATEGCTCSLGESI